MTKEEYKNIYIDSMDEYEKKASAVNYLLHVDRIEGGLPAATKVYRGMTESERNGLAWKWAVYSGKLDLRGLSTSIRAIE